MQTSFLWSQKHRIRALIAAKSPRAQSLVWLTGILLLVRQTYFESSFAATFENAKHIARLSNFPMGNGIKKIEQAFCPTFFKARFRILNQSLWRTVVAIAFTKASVLLRKAPVVIESSAPKHSAMRHHAAAHILCFDIVAPGSGAGFRSNSEIARVDETDKLPTLSSEQGGGPFRVCAAVFTVALPLVREEWAYVRKLLESFDVLGVVAGLSR